MRMPTYLSPTSISLWGKDRDEFYLYYLADNRPPRIPQNQAMSIGAAFDAYVKSFLHERLFGKGANPLFEFNTLFEVQVEPHNRDWALIHGAHVFESYRRCGALADLLLDLQGAQGDPKFEMTVQGNIVHSACVGGVPMLGKPDIWFINKSGVFIVFDWKVNGYCSVSITSPKKGFVKIYDAHVEKMSKGHLLPHKDSQLMLVDGININIGHFLEEIEKSWADQTAIYSWILGAPVGSKFTIAIDQIVCKGSDCDFPYLRVAAHRCRVSAAYQEILYNKIADIWNRIVVGPGAIFDDMNQDNSEARCAVLDKVNENYESDHKYSDWFNENTRNHRNF